jgi:FtsH-binding integral membrane protein
MPILAEEYCVRLAAGHWRVQMADYENVAYRARTGVEAEGIDEGLRSYMLRVYNYMVVALVTTGVTAYGLFKLAFTTDASVGVAAVNSLYFLTPLGASIFATPFVYVLMFAPLAFSLFLSFRITAFSWQTSFALLIAFSAVMGLSMSLIFATYVAADIVRVFFITAIAFGGLSLFGYTTKMDLSPMRSFLVMAVWGLLAASLLNFFVFSSSSMDWIISVLGVLIFGGVMVFQTQELKGIYYETGGTGEVADRAAVGGAYVLYVAFINMFMFLLRLLGNRQE